jgi:tripartite-type tricarboxylate transporter receptor subunit TctC
LVARRALLTAVSLFALPARAETPGWPSRPIVLTVPFPAGGSADLLARLLAERLPTQLDPAARMVVENRAGAGGIIGSDFVRRQPADGHALILATPSTHGTVPALQPDTTPYDPVADFTPIAIMGRAPIALAVPARSPHRDVAALLAALRAEPGQASWGSSGSGSIGHLAGEMMALAAGDLRAEHVPYRGGAPLVEALAKAEIAYAWEPLGSLAAAARDGLLRCIGMGSVARHPLFPDVPTMREAGLADFEATTWNLLLAPRGLPPAITLRLNAAANAGLADPVLRDRLAAAGIDAVADSTPAATGAFVAAELARFRDVVARAGLRLPR